MSRVSLCLDILFARMISDWKRLRTHHILFGIDWEKAAFAVQEAHVVIKDLLRRVPAEEAGIEIFKRLARVVIIGRSILHSGKHVFLGLWRIILIDFVWIAFVGYGGCSWIVEQCVHATSNDHVGVEKACMSLVSLCLDMLFASLNSD